MLTVSIQEKFEQWLSDGETFIGVFENQAMDSADLGRRIAMSFDVSQWDSAIIGKARAPDHKDIGTGWKYILIGKTKDVAEALELLIREDWVNVTGVPR